MTKEVFCPNCARFQPLIEEALHKDDLNPYPWGDLLCGYCRLVIATVRDCVDGQPFQSTISTPVPMTDHIHDYSEGEERCRFCGQHKPWRNQFG